MKYIFVTICTLMLFVLPVSASDAIYITSPDTVIIDGIDASGSDVVPLAFTGNRPLAGGYYIDAVTDELGDLLIYVPINYVDGYLTYTSAGNLFNLSSSTITCIGFTNNGTQYTVRFSSFSEPQYRLYDYNVSTYYDLTVEEVSGTNVRILEDDAPIPISSDVLGVLLLVFVGGILVWVFWKH